jgi:DNA-binding HxlR family transcriptional regulator
VQKTCDSPETFEQAVKLVGDFWTLRIIDALRSDELRFCGIERALPDINPATLTNRLKRLEEYGLITRQLETCDKQSVAYGLSSKGKSVIPVLDAIDSFTKQ